MLPYRFWELGAGAIYFQLQMEPHAACHAALGSPGPGGVGAVLILARLLCRPQAYPFPWAVPAVLGSLLVIAAVSGKMRQPHTFARVLRCDPWSSSAQTFLTPCIYGIGRSIVLFRWTVGLDDLAFMALAVVPDLPWPIFPTVRLSALSGAGDGCRGDERRSSSPPVWHVSIVLLADCQVRLWAQYRFSASVVMRHRETGIPIAPNENRRCLCPRMAVRDNRSHGDPDFAPGLSTRNGHAVFWCRRRLSRRCILIKECC